MKQKIVYTVLLVAAMYFPASSKECAKICCAGVTAKNTVQVKQAVPVETEEISALPASPFSRLLF
jgi:hypothetical protein